MKIDLFHAAADRYAGEIVAAALVRSFSTAQVNVVHQATGAAAGAAVWINPPEDMCLDLRRLMSSGGKALVLGRIGPRVAAALGLEHVGQLAWPAAWGQCTPHAETPYDVSPAAVRYVDRHPLARQSPLGVRPLCRFDFADEWNNLGFGRIGTSGDAWSLQSAIETGGRQAAGAPDHSGRRAPDLRSLGRKSRRRCAVVQSPCRPGRQFGVACGRIVPGRLSTRRTAVLSLSRRSARLV